MFQPSSWASFAMARPPNSPCSSPERPARTMEPSKRYWLSTRAASRTPAIPEALSLAPGESAVRFMGSDTRESMSPLMTA